MFVTSVTYTKIGTIQRRLAWPLRKDDTQIREAFQILQHCAITQSRNHAVITTRNSRNDEKLTFEAVFIWCVKNIGETMLEATRM